MTPEQRAGAFILEAFEAQAHRARLVWRTWALEHKEAGQLHDLVLANPEARAAHVAKDRPPYCSFCQDRDA